jgi:hypothetical protein
MVRSMAVDWLRAKVPGFSNLSEDERSAIVDFSLLWSLFEARILDAAGSASRICAAVDSWQNAGTLQADAYDQELAYFRQRYFANNDFTYHFHNLHLRPNDREALVRAVIDGSNNDPQDRVAAILIIILRYRNNLFHGVKWQYKLAGQLNNFEKANSALMRALEQHGKLTEV